MSEKRGMIKKILAALGNADDAVKALGWSSTAAQRAASTRIMTKSS